MTSSSAWGGKCWALLWTLLCEEEPLLEVDSIVLLDERLLFKAVCWIGDDFRGKEKECK